MFGSFSVFAGGDLFLRLKLIKKCADIHNGSYLYTREGVEDDYQA